MALRLSSRPCVSTISTLSPGVTKPPTAVSASTLIAIARVLGRRLCTMVTFSPKSETFEARISSPWEMARVARRGGWPVLAISTSSSVIAPGGSDSRGQDSVCSICGWIGWPKGMSRPATMTVTILAALSVAAVALLMLRYSRVA